ncbi:MAG: nucleotide exchange factor GrpE, partial [Bacteroidales bacterium]|nr:nucleotide exchange factor GrpE [Bacteroidales bacterium]
RLYADFDNFRKRTARERLELIKTASEDVVMSLLPVIDDFERALAVELFGPQAAATAASTVIEPDAAKGTAFEGVALIYHKLNKILTQNGVSVIDVLDQPFDEEWSEAVAQIPTPEGKTKGNVLDVVLKGYKIDNKVIRHAKVVVGI